MPIFKGAGVAITTPFKENGDVDYDKFAEQIEFQIKNKTDSIIVCGSTGEAATLTEKEHIEVIEFCIKQVNGRIPVIAGTGSNCTRTAIELSQEAEKAGADALLLVTPYYNKATQKGLIKHYKEVASSVKLPIIVYSVKSRTGMNIEPETVCTLVNEVPNIVGIKEASGDISQIARIMSLCGDKVELYSGNDDQTIPILSLGGIGVISVLSNVAPEFTHDMVINYLEGRTAEAAKMQLKSVELVDALFCETNPIPVKAALEILGMDTGVLRMPLTHMEPHNVERLKKAMQNFGLI